MLRINKVFVLYLITRAIKKLNYGDIDIQIKQTGLLSVLLA